MFVSLQQKNSAFWRTVTGIEVDFIVYGENGLFAFEIKSSEYFERKDLKGLLEFKRDFPIAQCYLIYSGKHEELHSDIAVLPIETAFKKLQSMLAQAK